MAYICSALRAPQMFRFSKRMDFLSDAGRPYAFATSPTLSFISILGKFSKFSFDLEKF